ncbi:NAD+ diphosphatase [Jatrophihabitans endophyticus]|uniref:NAD(+) diphosphatase n=1 Tax=Jatrophihabitans endophyticus TaxID=1206085 RepID=A0A1M5EQX2_9ACTN|nr:NAD(+) diphosphatase [Jatrophihabitans endophyticus]SHF81655.1 NAD+ diphosphatase [Jatrophihabitans endophyticus]
MTGPGDTPEAPPLARSAFDRAAHRRTDDDWLAAAWSRSRVVVVSPRSATPVGRDGRAEFRDPGAAPDGPRRFLGVVADVPYFAVTAPAPADADGWQTLRDIGAVSTDLEGALLATAIGLEQWHQRHGHCPRCGAATDEQQSGWVRICTVDGSHHFPRTDPAVIMLITDDSPGRELALLGRGHQWGAGRFSTLAGFVEPGESLEQAVAREVFEEVGVRVTDVRYVASQPWPFPASLMLGFEARLVGAADLTLDPVEMAEAGWFTRDEVRRAADWTDDLHTPLEGDGARLRGIPPHFSISRFLIDRWLADED